VFCRAAPRAACARLPLGLSQESEITHVSDTIDLASMEVEDGYKGPRMQGEVGAH
jgi:hypothetical protein